MKKFEVRVETLHDKFDEVLPLCERHWDEVPFGPWRELGLNINRELYNQAEATGHLLFVTARDDNKEVIGYIVLMSCEMNHHKGIQHASTDVVYVDPVWRGDKVFEAMISYCTGLCRELGISFLSVGVNPNFDFSDKLKNAGAVCTEKIYTWRL